MPIINRHISSLEKIKCNVEEAKQVAASHDFSIVEIESNFGTESQLQKTFSCFKKKDPEGQDTVLLSVNGIKYVSKAQSELDRLRVPAIESLINCLQKRFSSFDNQDFFKHLFWIDPANWTDLTTENEFLEWCYTYFKVPLEYQNFEVCKLKSEWKDFKYTVNYFFDGVGARNMWQQIFQHRKEQFPNICKLAEIILCIGPSNGVVEAGFSHLNSMLLDRRLCLNHGSMADLLLIKINDLVWTEKEKGLIINSAVDKFLSSKRRKRQIDHDDSIPSTSSSSMGEVSLCALSKDTYIKQHINIKMHNDAGCYCLF
ncbi:hypothetical protein SNE40_005922 [Patella caerulea]|uniref:HAT C-terminal dimerisation domain-containing protein n=1 Tax=Patella caerulea TaxID=87958 RepID=A0AAN8K6E0_PATCE